MIIIAGLVLAFVLILIFGNRRTRACRWREDRRAGEHRCITCGARAKTPPRGCLSPQSDQ